MKIIFNITDKKAFHEKTQLYSDLPRVYAEKNMRLVCDGDVFTNCSDASELIWVWFYWNCGSVSLWDRLTTD